MVLARDSARELREDPATPARLREQLALVEAARQHGRALGLEVGEQYTSYVDWPGDRVITTVVATRPGEVDAHDFRFPLVGRVPYKGFFDIESAEAEAAELEAEGLDVCLVPVTAYSTLGWLDDPVTAPMLVRGDDTRLVETILHELVHATVFVADQPSFNEGVARFIGQEAAIRFFEADAEASARVRARVRDDRAVADTLLDFRAEVKALYQGSESGPGRDAERQRLEADFRELLATTPLETRDTAQLAERAGLNDACLAIGGTYAEDNERHVGTLRALGGDLARFVERLREAADAPDPRGFFFGEVPDDLPDEPGGPGE